MHILAKNMTLGFRLFRIRHQMAQILMIAASAKDSPHMRGLMPETAIGRMQPPEQIHTARTQLSNRCERITHL
jgi:hypothetical protein